MDVMFILYLLIEIYCLFVIIGDFRLFRSCMEVFVVIILFLLIVFVRRRIIVIKMEIVLVFMLRV